jgi:hypothetical protein
LFSFAGLVDPNQVMVAYSQPEDTIPDQEPRIVSAIPELEPRGWNPELQPRIAFPRIAVPRIAIPKRMKLFQRLSPVSPQNVFVEGN